MAGFGDIVQKAFYLGVGIASYAGEKAGSRLVELRQQAQKLADDMVARGEVTAEDAQRIVNEMVSRAQQQSSEAPTDSAPPEPRRIEILTDDEEPEANQAQADELRRQVEALQAELQKLKHD
ncbi:MAG: hypothetical protein F6K19_38390 [Cyanothece sp. SIO1E1]|nr:hypothetical protein [Cyanothece sp. SIO1E1]